MYQPFSSIIFDMLVSSLSGFAAIGLISFLVLIHTQLLFATTKLKLLISSLMALCWNILLLIHVIQANWAALMSITLH